MERKTTFSETKGSIEPTSHVSVHVQGRNVLWIYVLELTFVEASHVRRETVSVGPIEKWWIFRGSWYPVKTEYHSEMEGHPCR
jgi:hypothetical protein